MSEIQTVRISGLTEKTKYSDTDYLVMGGDEAYRISASKMASQATETLSNNVATIAKDTDDIKAYLGYSNEEIVGLQVDYENKTFQRLAGAYNLSAGADFDNFLMYGGRRRCTVADDGTITSWYGDDDYAEDGSMGQVMVYQPKFYFKTVPLKLEAQTDGVGYHLRKANYYVSATPKTGFKLHPAFIDESGNEVDYIMLSAYEGILWDADGGDDGTGAWLADDRNYSAKTVDTSADMLGSVAGCQPVSYITKTNFEIIAKNRGIGWHSDLIKPINADQILTIIEMGTMNLQTAIAKGVDSSSNNSSYNCSVLTGSTSELGNGTGQATSSIGYNGTSQSGNGKTSVSYRGVENPWGNIFKLISGINVVGNGSQKGGIPYICSDYDFGKNENENSGKYISAGFTLPNKNGYISAMGYGGEDYDWLFIPSEATGNSSLPVGDYAYIYPDLNGAKTTSNGGYWSYSTQAGPFFWFFGWITGIRLSTNGSRLTYIPTKDSASYTANITSWQEQMSK